MTATAKSFIQLVNATEALERGCRELRQKILDLPGMPILAASQMSSVSKCRLIIREVATAYGISPKAITGRRRTDAIVEARHVAMWFCFRYCGDLRRGDIGDLFGHRDHTSVSYAMRSIEDRAETDAITSERIGKIEATLKTIIKKD